MPQYISNDPNFGLSSGKKYASLDPDFGIEKPTLPELPSPFKRPLIPAPKDPSSNSLISTGLRVVPPIAGGMIGSLGGPIGTAAGGGIGAGLGEAAASFYEGNKINPKTVALESAIGALPLGGGKLPSAMIKGAGINAADLIGRNLSESGQLPPIGEIGKSAALGGAFGGAAHYGGEVLGKIFRKEKSLEVPIPEQTKTIPNIQTEVPKPIKAKNPIQLGAPTESPILNSSGQKTVTPGKVSLDPSLLEVPEPTKSISQVIQKSPVKIQRMASPIEWEGKTEDWVNSRNASQYYGADKKKQFSELDSLGQEGIKQIQDGENLKSVREYFDKKFKDVQKVIPDIRYRENYLPQLWNNDPNEINLVFGSKLTTRPSFTLKRVIQDYQTGIDKGLQPKFNTVSDLVGWYETTANKAIADREFFSYLKDSKLIKPTNLAGKDWKSLNADTFPIILDKRKRGATWSAPPEVSDKINNILNQDTSLIGKAAKVSSFSKNMMLTGGIPKTGFNWHTAVSIPTRSLVAGGIKTMVKNYYYDARPGAAGQYIQDNMGKAADAVKHGMGLGAEGFWASVKPEQRNLAQKFEGAFSDPAFKEIIPALKLETWDKTWQSFAAKGMDVKSAKKAAAKFVNDSYGGIQNPLRSKEAKNILQLGLLAPDWAETKFNLGRGALKGLLNPKDPVGQKYLKTVGMMVGLVAAESAVGIGIRKGLPSTSRMQNVPIGSTNKKDVEFVPSGTALDTVGLPAKIGADIARGNPTETIQNLGYQLSPWLQFIGDLIQGQDPLGNPLKSTDRFGNPVAASDQFWNVASDLMSYTVPQPIQSAVEAATGRVEPIQAITQGLELPARFYSKRK